MIKKILLIIAFIYASAAFAAVDVNQASAAELDGIKGIGPSISEKILTERKRAPFKDWEDFISRVSGIGEVTAAKFSAEGLRVNGKTFSAKKTTQSSNKKSATTSTQPTADASSTPKK